MSMQLRVCLCVRVSVCMRACVCVSVRACVCAYVSAFACLCICVCACVCACVDNYRSFLLPLWPVCVLPPIGRDTTRGNRERGGMEEAVCGVRNTTRDGAQECPQIVTSESRVVRGMGFLSQSEVPFGQGPPG